MLSSTLLIIATILSVADAFSYTSHSHHPAIIQTTATTKQSFLSLSSTTDDNNNEEAQKLQEKAQKLREQIRQMESTIGDKRSNNNALYIKEKEPDNDHDDQDGNSLKNKRVLVLGANGRLGSMVTRYLLRTYGNEIKEVVAACHYVGQATTRGYGRLSYEVGAEDGVGTIGAAWDGEDANASFQYDPETMDGYNLNKLRIVEVELLDPVQVQTITEDVDAIIFCATDFEGNRPRAVASLNAAFLFRAVADPTKGRVEIEGVRNCLEGLMNGINQRKWKDRLEPGGDVDSIKKNKTGPINSTVVKEPNHCSNSSSTFCDGEKYAKSST